MLPPKFWNKLIFVGVLVLLFHENGHSQDDVNFSEDSVKFNPCSSKDWHPELSHNISLGNMAIRFNIGFDSGKVIVKEDSVFFPESDWQTCFEVNGLSTDSLVLHYYFERKIHVYFGTYLHYGPRKVYGDADSYRKGKHAVTFIAHSGETFPLLYIQEIYDSPRDFTPEDSLLLVSELSQKGSPPDEIAELFNYWNTLLYDYVSRVIITFVHFREGRLMDKKVLVVDNEFSY
jgi:hypothetical protein